jgi:hypothetical protein
MSGRSKHLRVLLQPLGRTQWGRKMRAEAIIISDDQLSLATAHQVAEEAQYRLLHSHLHRGESEPDQTCMPAPKANQNPLVLSVAPPMRNHRSPGPRIRSVPR